MTFTILLALIVGVILVLAGIAHMGAISDFLSEPVLKGFIVGVALTIALGQAGKLFGFETEAEGFFAEIFDLFRQLPETHATTLVVGVVSLIALGVFERLITRIPSVLLVVVGSILAVKVFGLPEAGVSIVGEIPSGLPSFAVSTAPRSVVVGTRSSHLAPDRWNSGCFHNVTTMEQQCQAQSAHLRSPCRSV